jgi:hypothetical protein
LPLIDCHVSTTHSLGYSYRFMNLSHYAAVAPEMAGGAGEERRKPGHEMFPTDDPPTVRVLPPGHGPRGVDTRRRPGGPLRESASAAAGDQHVQPVPPWRKGVGSLPRPWENVPGGKMSAKRGPASARTPSKRLAIGPSARGRAYSHTKSIFGG